MNYDIFCRSVVDRLQRRAAARGTRQGLLGCAIAVVIGAASFDAGAQQPPDTVKSDRTANTAMGIDALLHVVVVEGGTWNTAAGAFALENDSTGNLNTALGAYAMQDNTNGYLNTASGAEALRFNTSGNSNTAIGAEALLINTTGSNNTAAGLSALVNSSTGSDNAAFGASALATAYGASRNTAVGSRALISAETSDNTAVGYSALGGAITGSAQDDTGVGSGALHKVQGTGNTAVGFHSGYAAVEGDNNTIVGASALSSIGAGSSNIAIGAGSAQKLVSGSSNIDIGNPGAAQESGIIRIGTPGTQTKTYLAGIVGVPISGSAVYVTATGQLGVAPSSERYKTDIAPIGPAADKLRDLRPVHFRLKNDPDGSVQYGLIAEEVDKVFPELVIRDAGGTIQGVHYEELAPMLISELQQEQAVSALQREKLAEQQRAIDELREQMGQMRRLGEAMQSALRNLQSEAAH